MDDLVQRARECAESLIGPPNERCQLGSSKCDSCLAADLLVETADRIERLEGLLRAILAEGWLCTSSIKDSDMEKRVRRALAGEDL